MKSREGWQMVGHQFVMEWQMVWEEVLIGFTIAGFMAVFVPPDLVGEDISYRNAPIPCRIG